MKINKLEIMPEKRKNYFENNIKDKSQNNDVKKVLNNNCSPYGHYHMKIPKIEIISCVNTAQKNNNFDFNNNQNSQNYSQSEYKKNNQNIIESNKPGNRININSVNQNNLYKNYFENPYQNKVNLTNYNSPIYHPNQPMNNNFIKSVNFVQNNANNNINYQFDNNINNNIAHCNNNLIINNYIGMNNMNNNINNNYNRKYNIYLNNENNKLKEYNNNKDIYHDIDINNIYNKSIMNYQTSTINNNTIINNNNNNLNNNGYQKQENKCKVIKIYNNAHSDKVVDRVIKLNPKNNS